MCIRTAGVPLRALWVGDNNNAWAVGNNGTVLKWNGTAWTNQTSGISSNLRGVFGLGLNDVWTVGWEGAIFRGSGSVWSPQMSDITAESLPGIFAKRFGGVQALNDVGLDVLAGQVHGLIGPNGAGKTTAMRMLCGLSFPSSGKAMVAGFDLYKEAEKIKNPKKRIFAVYTMLTPVSLIVKDTALEILSG